MFSNIGSSDRLDNATGEKRLRIMWHTNGIIALILIAVGCVTSRPSVGADDVHRLLSAIAQLGIAVPTLEDAQATCGADVLCAARLIQDGAASDIQLIPDDANIDGRAWPKGAHEYELVDLGNRRWRLAPEILDAGALGNTLTRIAETAQTLVLDLRNYTRAGEVDEMRQFAASLAGTIPRAFSLTTPEGRKYAWSLSAPRRASIQTQIEVWIGADTSSLGAILAQLLRDHTNARLLGAPTSGANTATRRVAVTHGWSLLVRRGELEVPSLIAGQPVIPDGPLPPDAKPYDVAN